MGTRVLRWLFADQLGPGFHDGGPAVLILSRQAFARRVMHRAKAQLLLSAMLHRAQSAEVQLVIADSYRDGLKQLEFAQLEVVDPTSHAARRLVRSVGARVLPSRGFVTSEDDFREWASGRNRLRLEDFYRHVRAGTGVLMDDDQPVGGRWNFDADNRQRPPKARDLGLSVAWPQEDALDAQARDLMHAGEEQGWLNLRGQAGPRWFAVTRAEALAALSDFVSHRLRDFGPYEDAAMGADPVMAHSLLSVPMNLGLLDPREAIEAVLQAYHRGEAPLNSVEGFIRQVMGWRDFVWHLYWWFGPEYLQNNFLDAREEPPDWFIQADSAQVQASCMSDALRQVHDHGWTHHIVRLEILGNWALQRGYEPATINAWFTDMFVDGFAWVMPANVLGMALYADGGAMSTKPYAAGGAYINRMTNYCSGCRYRPDRRVGEQACPFTAGYWAFLAGNAAQLRGNHRMRNPYATMGKLRDLDELLAQEAARTGPP